MYAGLYLRRAAPEWGDLDFLKERKTGDTFRLTQMIGTKWEAIGTRLGMERDVLDSISSDCRTNEARLVRVLSTWLSNAGGLPHPEEYPLSWQGLRNLLDDSDITEVASKYFEFLGKMSA